MQDCIVVHGEGLDAFHALLDTARRAGMELGIERVERKGRPVVSCPLCG